MKAFSRSFFILHFLFDSLLFAFVVEGFERDNEVFSVKPEVGGSAFGHRRPTRRNQEDPQEYGQIKGRQEDNTGCG